jgi:hypothetical protein
VGSNPFNWVDPLGFSTVLPDSQADRGYYSDGFWGWVEMARDLGGEMNSWNNPGVGVATEIT